MTTPMPPAMPPGATVLLADDDRSIRTVLSRALNRIGCRVRATGSASALWRMVEDGEGDITVTGAGAIDLAQGVYHLRLTPSTANPAILSVTPEVRVRGPLGDPEFTLTRGIVSKARTRGETNWASVDAVIEHDATINPGNSGGPLVTTDGKVVGINYAGSQGTSQFFAISRDEALKVIDQLRTGQDVNSIGVNGTAILSEDGTLSGVWVASVKSGSPASNVGIRGGDVIIRLEGLVLATDGTMADYCDVLRTHSPGDVLSIEVLRFDTREMLEGKLNDYRLKPIANPTPTPTPMP